MCPPVFQQSATRRARRILSRSELRSHCFAEALLALYGDEVIRKVPAGITGNGGADKKYRGSNNSDRVTHCAKRSSFFRMERRERRVWKTTSLLRHFIPSQTVRPSVENAGFWNNAF